MFIIRTPEEVQRYHLAFHCKRGDWWFERLIPGRFTHVSAFAYLTGPRMWLLIENSPRTNARVCLWPDDGDVTMPPGLIAWTSNCSILAADVRRRYDFRLKLGFWCVSAAKDLIGSRSRALSPEGCWRDLLSRRSVARL